MHSACFKDGGSYSLEQTIDKRRHLSAGPVALCVSCFCSHLCLHGNLSPPSLRTPPPSALAWKSSSCHCSQIQLHCFASLQGLQGVNATRVASHVALPASSPWQQPVCADITAETNVNGGEKLTTFIELQKRLFLYHFIGI